MRLFLVNRRLTAVVLGIAVLLTMFFIFFNDNQIHSLKTDNSFRFIVMGDSQGPDVFNQVNEKRLRQLLEKVKELSIQPSFIMFSGDMVYGEYDVEDALNQWKDIVDDYYSLNKVYTALGNHENDERAFSRAFTNLPNNQLPNYLRTVYYFDYRNARFIVLNSNRKDRKHAYVINDEQLAWLKKTLRSSDKDHHFVMLHVPAYPVGRRYHESLDANPEQRNAFWDIIDNYNVTAVFVGHEHNYNRRLIDSSFEGYGYTYENKIYQITDGSAGGETNECIKDHKNVKGPYGVYCYTVVDVKDDTAVFNVFDINNKKIDSFQVKR